MAAITGRGCCSMMSPTACPRSVWAMRSFQPLAASSFMSDPAFFSEGLAASTADDNCRNIRARHFFQVLLQQQQGGRHPARCAGAPC